MLKKLVEVTSSSTKNSTEKRAKKRCWYNINYSLGLKLWGRGGVVVSALDAQPLPSTRNFTLHSAWGNLAMD